MSVAKLQAEVLRLRNAIRAYVAASFNKDSRSIEELRAGLKNSDAHESAHKRLDLKAIADEPDEIIPVKMPDVATEKPDGLNFWIVLQVKNHTTHPVCWRSTHAEAQATRDALQSAVSAEEEKSTVWLGRSYFFVVPVTEAVTLIKEQS